jgi:hypothetical protein
MIQCFSLLFAHGICHIVAPTLIETNYDEITPTYRTALARWVYSGLAGPEALADYARLGWQVRLTGAASWPEMQATADVLAEATPQRLDGPCVWFTTASYAEARWDELFAAMNSHAISSRAEAIRVLYGQDIPLATLFIGSGKPQMLASVAPPLLVGNLQCYWRQHLGYDLDERTLRTILYDYAFLRKTWQQDKEGRAEIALAYQEVWQDPPVIGIGVRLGPFWYPAPITPVPSSPHKSS